MNDEDTVSLESLSMLIEAAILENASSEEINEYVSNHGQTQSDIKNEIVTERTIVKLDKNAKISKMTKLAAFQIAKEKNDPKFKKLLTIWRMERFLEAYLIKRYGAEAQRRAKKAVMSAGKSSTPLVKKVAANVHNQLNGDRHFTN